MTAAWVCFNAELRRNLRSWTVLAFVVAIAAGSVLALVAGSRRTDSAYARFLESHAPADLLIGGSSDFGVTRQLDLDAVAALPQVDDSAKASSFLIASGRTDSGRSLRAGIFVPFAAADRRLGNTVNRWKLLAGRRADPSRVDEVVLSFEAARENDLGVGDRFRIDFLNQSAFLGYLPHFLQCVVPRTAGTANGECAATGIASAAVDSPSVRFTVVGIAAAPTEFPPLPGNVLPPVHMTPAFMTQHGASLARTDVLYVRLLDDANASSFLRDAQALSLGTTLTVYSVGADNARNVTRAIHYQAIGLGILAALVGISVAFALIQAFARQAFLADDSVEALRALGLRRGQFVVIGALRAGVTAIFGAAAAVIVAVALSPIWPVGLAGKAEPDPGVAVDASVLATGAALIIGVALLSGTAGTLRKIRRETSTRAERDRPTLGAWLTRHTRLPVTASIGIRHALEPGRGRTAVPVRSAILATALSVAAMVAAVTYVASSDQLLNTRESYGWAHDAQIGRPGLPSFGLPISQGLEARADVRNVAMGTITELEVNGARVSALAVDDVVGSVSGSVVDGRKARANDEIVLGSITMRDSGIGLGDQVRVRANGDPIPMTVVGRAVFAKIGDNGQLGRGAQITFAALLRLVPDPPANILQVDFEPGVDEDKARTALQHDLDVIPLLSPAAPTDLTSFGGVRTLPVALAAVMLIVAVAILGHALLTSIRRRERDFAILEVFGFVHRQKSLTVSTQATTFVVVALVLGIPAGLILGRWGWDAIAAELGVPSDPTTQPSAIAAVALGLVVTANVVAVVPALLARRTRAAAALRAP